MVLPRTILKSNPNTLVPTKRRSLPMFSGLANFVDYRHCVYTITASMTTHYNALVLHHSCFATTITLVLWFD